jgi:hypothetical protein
MRFMVLTLVDITQTNARRADGDKFAYSQQQNYNTLVNTMGLRTNILPLSDIKIEDRELEPNEFGKEYSGTHKVWSFPFEVEAEDSLSIEMLEQDFDLVPVITNLNETVKINNNVFRTNGAKDNNIRFITIHY